MTANNSTLKQPKSKYEGKDIVDRMRQHGWRHIGHMMINCRQDAMHDPSTVEWHAFNCYVIAKDNVIQFIEEYTGRIVAQGSIWNEEEAKDVFGG